MYQVLFTPAQNLKYKLPRRRSFSAAKHLVSTMCTCLQIGRLAWSLQKWGSPTACPFCLMKQPVAVAIFPNYSHNTAESAIKHPHLADGERSTSQYCLVTCYSSISMKVEFCVDSSPVLRCSLNNTLFNVDLVLTQTITACDLIT